MKNLMSVFSLLLFPFLFARSRWESHGAMKRVLFASVLITLLIPLVLQADSLTLQKTNTPCQIKLDAETTVLYTLTITNPTDSNISTFLSDPLPSEVIAATVTGTVPAGFVCIGTLCGCPGCTIPANSSVDINISATVHPTSTDPITNTASMIFSGGTATASSTIEVIKNPKPVYFLIEKIPEAEVIPTNTNFTYTIFVSNYSNNNAYVLHVDDIFPDTYIDYVDTNGSTGWSCSKSGTLLSCDFNDTLMPQEITHFTINARTGSIERDYVTNEANISALNEITDNYNRSISVDINISDDSNASGIGGVYLPGGYVDISDHDFATMVQGWRRSDAYIQTKVASTVNTTLHAYYVDTVVGNSQSYGSGIANAIPLTVIFNLAVDLPGGGCREAYGGTLSYDPSSGEPPPVVAIFNDNDTKVNAGTDPQDGVYTFDLRNIAERKARIIMKYMDINAKLDTSGETCGASSLSGNIKGLPQCIANSGGSNNLNNNKFINVFGIQTFVRCVAQNGQPCKSSNGGYGDYPYDHEYGCYQCIVGDLGYCSNDNFAIRPETFEVNLLDSSPFRADKPYHFVFKAYTSITDEETYNYNEHQDAADASFYIDANVSNNNCQIKSLDISPKVHFLNGERDGTFSFSDIGDIDFSIHETNGTEFAKVDADDTVWADRHITEDNATFTVIPDHFGINATLSDHNSADNFTYISADLNMSSTLDINITAQSFEDNTTFNYTENCYAYPIDLDIALAYDPDPMTPNTLSPILYLLKAKDSTFTVDGNSSNINLINGTDLDNLSTSIFPGGDDNGTAILSINLNFDRKYNEVVNPFEMNVTDVNATDDDTTDTSGAIQYVKGTGAPDDNATYYFARAKSSKYFYDDVTDSSIVTPISVVVYDNPGFPSARDFLIFTTTNENNWYLSTQHNRSNGDGNVTLSASPSASVSPSQVDLTDGSQEVTVSYNGTTKPQIVNIDFVTANPTDTSRWLIYNPDANAIHSPFYRVRFIGPGGNWSTTGNLPGVGHVVGDDISTKKAKRLEW